MALFDKVLAGSAAGGMAVAAGVERMLQTLPGFAAAFGMFPVSQPVADVEVGVTANIGESDILHMNGFPARDKGRVMDRIMSLTPLSTEVRSKRNDYEKLLLLLRKDGFALIDMQPLETALTTVWYHKSVMPARFAREEVTMLLWETQAAGEATTLIRWRI
jgi:hypothetical protein